jgi:serine/threonine protein kinase
VSLKLAKEHLRDFKKQIAQIHKKLAINAVKNVDMWAVGVVAYTVLVGYPPFEDTEPGSLKLKIKKGLVEFHDAYWRNISSEAKVRYYK